MPFSRDWCPFSFVYWLVGWFTIAADVEALKRSRWESLEYTPVDAELVIIDRARATALPILLRIFAVDNPLPELLCCDSDRTVEVGLELIAV